MEDILECKQINSIKDLAEQLRVNHTELNDCTFVYCHSGKEELESASVKQAMRLVRYETNNQILTVRDQALAQKLKMRPGVFYCYYKPSYVNGFGQFQGQDIDFPYLQAFEGVCRDEFQPIESEVASTQAILNGQIADKVFDQCFKRTHNVQFTFNTDIKNSFKHKYKHGRDADKPILFILWPEMFMSQFIGEFDQVLRKYNDMFDVYYCSREDDAKPYFNTKIMPKELAHMYIIDP